MARSLEERVGRLEAKVFPAHNNLKPRLSAYGDDQWSWCQRASCTKGSYKSLPVCRNCAGWDPRLGDYPPGEKPPRGVE